MITFITDQPADEIYVNSEMVPYHYHAYFAFIAFLVWFGNGLTSHSTIFQSCWEGATAS